MDDIRNFDCLNSCGSDRGDQTANNKGNKTNGKRKFKSCS